MPYKPRLEFDDPYAPHKILEQENIKKKVIKDSCVKKQEYGNYVKENYLPDFSETQYNKRMLNIELLK